MKTVFRNDGTRIPEYKVWRLYKNERTGVPEYKVWRLYIGIKGLESQNIKYEDCIGMKG